MKVTIITVLGCLLCLAGAFRVAGAAEEAGHEGLTHEIAACMLLSYQEEIALAQFAEQHAEHADVKEFAKALVAAHTNAVASIKKAAPEVADLQLTSGKGITSDSKSQHHQALAMLQQVKSECLALTEKELGEYKGNEFDQAFIGQQVGAHIGMLAQLRGSKDFASPELQKVISEGEKTTEAHMAAAKKIMSQLKTNASTTARVGQRPAAGTR
ncbi:DUF4142 domain-containing protein [Lacipirellula parvula]|uniref:DUF4142 domain-containing protein n=1 Tax=Lacipirellula parvula TaxID=2650471 RepID=A0A5K7XAI7_9BACT|nr:DUF4142 domain-containing protein [Lacipirellula parvula]BBO33435.1 hypothetical protein PLANPX_3047 [Lacipirellula parvula]